MKNKFLVAIGTLLLLATGSCRLPPPPEPQGTVYFFEKSLKISTVKKEYSVGDTLWVEASLPNRILRDQQTQRDILIRNAAFNLTTKIDFLAIEPVPLLVERYDILIEAGEASKDELFPQNGDAVLGYGCPDSEYSLRVGFLFKQAGNYVFLLNPDRLVSFIFFDDTDNCAIQNIFPPPNDADWANVYYDFEVEDSNLDVFDEIVGDMDNDPLIEDYRERLELKRAFFLSVR